MNSRNTFLYDTVTIVNCFGQTLLHDIGGHIFGQTASQPITKGLAKYGRTKVIFGICMSRPEIG